MFLNAVHAGPGYDREGSQTRSSGSNAHYGRDRLNPEDYKLYVAGLPHCVNEELLRSIFGQYGTVVNTQVLQRPSNDTTLAGYVTMADPEMAIWVMENLNGNIAPGVAFVLSIRYAVAPQKLDIDPSKMVARSREQCTLLFPRFSKSKEQEAPARERRMQEAKQRGQQKVLWVQEMEQRQRQQREQCMKVV